MRHVKRGLAVLLAALLVIPESPVAMGNLLRIEAAEADAILEEAEADVELAEESAGPEGADMVNSEVDGENGGEEEQGKTDNTVVVEEQGGEMTEEPSGESGERGEMTGEPPVVEESVNSSEMQDDVIDEGVPNGIEGDVKSGEGIGVEDDAEGTDLEETQPVDGLPGEEPIAAQVLEDDLPVAYAADIVASGADGNLTWTLDSDGLLTVSGTGDYGSIPSVNPNLWKDYKDSIISAKVDVTGMTDARDLFWGCHNLVSLDLRGFDTSSVTIMDGMFGECGNLTNLNLSSFNTSNVTDMHAMFYQCNSLTSLDLSSFDTRNVTEMWLMFSDCNSLLNLDLSSFNTSNVTDMVSMFQNCRNLMSLDVNSFDTSNVTDMSGMFFRCNSLTSLDVSSFDTNNVTDMNMMFFDCNSLTSLDVSSFDTGKVTNMQYMFSGCDNLSNIDVSSFDTSNVTDMKEMFGSNNLIVMPQTIHTPRRMGSATTDLPGVYAAPNGTQIRKLTADYAGMTLSKIEEKHNWSAYNFVIESYKTSEIGKEASFKVTVTNSTDRTLFTEGIYPLYYRETDNSDTYPGVEFGSLLSESGEATTTENITFAPGESRTFKLVGIIPDTWNDKSELLVTANGYDMNEMSYAAHGQGSCPFTEIGSHVVSSNYQEIQNAVTEEKVKTIDYILPDGQEISQEAQKEIFSGLQGSDKVMSFVFQDNQGEEIYRWTFEGSKITDPDRTLKFQIIVDARIPEVLAATPNDVQKVDLAFINEGVLPGVANIKVRVESYFQADRLYLYYYNPDKAILELVDDNVSFDGTYASFFLSHNSNYVLTAQMLRNLLPQKPDNVNKPASPGSSNKPIGNNGGNTDGNFMEGQESTSLLHHIVVKGDTLSRIARMYRTTISRLMSLNSAIKNPNLIYIGQIILVDGAVEISKEEDGIGEYHIIRKGDSFYKISRLYGIPLKELMLLNPKLSAQSYIFPGQRMLIKRKNADQSE